MDVKKIESIIEAILFTMGESVEISKLAELIEDSKENTKKIRIKGIDEKKLQCYTVMRTFL